MKKKILMIAFLILLAGCCSTGPSGRGIDGERPRLRDDNFWDYVPWWKSSITMVVEVKSC